MKRVVWLVIACLVAVISFFAFPDWSTCSDIERKVDSGQFQIRSTGQGWYIFTPPGFAQTVEYLNHFAGRLGRRISKAPDGWERYKLSKSCGGSTKVAHWASAKGIGPDGSRLPRVVVYPSWPVPGDRGRLPGDHGGPLDHWKFAIGGLLIVAAIMVRLHRRRLVFAK